MLFTDVGMRWYPIDYGANQSNQHYLCDDMLVNRKAFDLVLAWKDISQSSKITPSPTRSSGILAYKIIRSI